jgi:hypothetical protein
MKKIVNIDNDDNVGANEETRIEGRLTESMLDEIIGKIIEEVKPTRKHVNALKRIGCYLKGTRGKGIIMQPLPTLQVDFTPMLTVESMFQFKNKGPGSGVGCVEAARWLVNVYFFFRCWKLGMDKGSCDIGLNRV